MGQPINLSFEVTNQAEGGLSARCIGYPIFTEADSWDELRDKISEAVQAHFFDWPSTTFVIQLSEVREKFTVANTVGM